MIDTFIEALLALGALLVGASALINASGSRKLAAAKLVDAKTRLAEAQLVASATDSSLSAAIDRIGSRLTDLVAYAHDTRERVARIEGRQNGYHKK